MNKLGKITIAFAAALIIGIGGYFLFQAFIAPPTPQKSPASNEDQASPVTTVRLKTVAGEAIFDFWTNPKTNEIYYVDQNGRISKITPEGTTQSLTTQIIPSLSRINPSQDGSMAIISVGQQQNPSFSVFNVAKRNFQALPAGVTAAGWSAGSNNVVAYLQNNGSSSRLSSLNLATGKSTELLKISQKDLAIEWAFPESIYLYQRPSDQISSSVWSYDTKSKAIKKLVEEKSLSIKWWPERNLGLKWSNGKLSLMNKAGQQISSTNLKTLPGKCSFGEPFIYCAAVSEQRSVSGVNLTGNILQKSDTKNESIYSIVSLNLENGAAFPTSKIFDGGASDIPFRAARIEKQTDHLLILNEIDHKLYSLPL